MSPQYTNTLQKLLHVGCVDLNKTYPYQLLSRHAAFISMGTSMVGDLIALLSEQNND
jgi:hypothetical protein